MAIEHILLIGSALVLISIAIARLTDNIGVPTMLLFLGIGMLAGSEGPGGIYFDDPGLAQSIGIVALVFILFAGGLDTKWSQVRPVFLQATSLATVGVLLTALFVGVFAAFVLGFSLMNGLLLGAIIASTDAATVFSVLRSRNVSLRGKIKPLLELESGSNDPMTVFLTVGIIQILTHSEASIGAIVVQFIFQMGLGAAFGYGLGRAMVIVLNRLRLAYEGIYPVFLLAFAALVYALTTSVGGSGFLAVYVAGLVASNSEFIHKKSLIRFFDGLAWLSQITMFLSLGLLVFPSQLVSIIGIGLLISAFLMFVARPAGVFISLIGSKLGWKEKAFVSWVGLRGAVPIVLATFPLLAGLPDAHLVFNLVFFIVLTSALLQGWSIPPVARMLRVDAPQEQKRKYPIEFSPVEGTDTELVDLIVPYNSAAADKPIVQLGMPEDSLIVLVSRNEEFLVPSGGTVLQEGDTVLALVNKRNLPEVRSILARQNDPGTSGGPATPHNHDTI
jgi:potassium/hydrogen antiporter